MSRDLRRHSGCCALVSLAVVVILILVDEGDNHAVASQYVVLHPLVPGSLDIPVQVEEE